MLSLGHAERALRRAASLLKAENLQRTGSFKLRGALNRGRHRSTTRDGVVCGSAGNHAQALAYAARARGLACEVFMPRRGAGGQGRGGPGLRRHRHARRRQRRRLRRRRARARARDRGRRSCTRSTIPQVIAGQATLGLELLDQVPDLAKVIVPIGGGGLASGARRGRSSSRAPEVEVIGVQIAACAPFPAALAAGAPLAVDAGRRRSPTASRSSGPGALTLPLVERWVDEVVVVSEEDTAEAMVLLWSARSSSSRGPARSASPRCSPG